MSPQHPSRKIRLKKRKSRKSQQEEKKKEEFVIGALQVTTMNDTRAFEEGREREKNDEDAFCAAAILREKEKRVFPLMGKAKNGKKSLAFFLISSFLPAL